MESLFNRVLNFKGGDMDFEDHLTEMNLKFFDNLYAVYPQKDRARKAVKYIVFAYSKNSDYLLSGESWSEIKDRVAKLVELDEEMYNEMVNFQFKFVAKKTKKEEEEEADDGTGEVEANEYNVKKIVQCITDFLEYEGSKMNKHLRRMYDLYEQFSSASVNMITKGKNGAIDWDQKSLCQKEASRLYNEIEEWEQKIANTNAPLKKPIEELKTVRKKVTSLRPEVV